MSTDYSEVSVNLNIHNWREKFIILRPIYTTSQFLLCFLHELSKFAGEGTLLFFIVIVHFCNVQEI